jgi:hypothetical protein
MIAQKSSTVAFTTKGGCYGAANLSGIVGFALIGRYSIDLSIDHKIEHMNGRFIGGGGAGLLKAGNNGPCLSEGLVHCLLPKVYERSL